MDFGITGKKALVTGASAGLGLSAAISLAHEGAELFINSRDEMRLETAAAKIKEATGQQAKLIVADVSDKNAIELIKKITYGRVDILVSNAGGPPPGQFTEHDEERWQEAKSLTLDSARRLTRLVIDNMIEKKWGRLIYITSVGVRQPVDELILSNTYRAAVTGMVKTISNNYARFGITANCVCPGYTATERLAQLAKSRAEKENSSPDEVLKQIATAIPARRVGKPEELAALIAFLASEQAAYITGTSIPVDGGAVRALI